MTEPRVIRADYSNWRPVAGRKVLQLILEVPIEQTADVMAKLGVPMPGESKWCAVALLENGGPASGNDAGTRSQTQKSSDNSAAPIIPRGEAPSPTIATIATDGTLATPAKDRHPFASLPLAQQAAIRCSDAAFQRWVVANYSGQHAYLANEDTAAILVREHCKVASRANISEDDGSGLRWADLERKFKAHLTDEQYAGVRR